MYHIRTISATNPNKYIIVPVSGEAIGNPSSGGTTTPPIASPSISITSVSDASDGDNFVKPEGTIRISGKATNAQNVQFYFGNILLTKGSIDFLEDNFYANLQLPDNISHVSYQIRAVINTSKGNVEASGSIINITGYTVEQIINQIREIENSVPKKNDLSTLWTDQYNSSEVANTLRRKAWIETNPKKYSSGQFDTVPTWSNKQDGYATIEQIPELSDKQVITTDGMEIRVDHFIAALSFQFGTLIGVESYDASYVGDLGSVIGAIRNPKSWLNDPSYKGTPTWEEAFQKKAPVNQLDADIAAHIVAALVKKEKIKISEAIEKMIKMSLKEKYDIFTKSEFGYEVSSLKLTANSSLIDKYVRASIQNTLNQRIIWFLEKHFALGVDNNISNYEVFVPYDDELNKVSGDFLDYLSRAA